MLQQSSSILLYLYLFHFFFFFFFFFFGRFARFKTQQLGNLLCVVRFSARSFFQEKPTLFEPLRPLLSDLSSTSFRCFNTLFVTTSPSLRNTCESCNVSREMFNGMSSQSTTPQKKRKNGGSNPCAFFESAPFRIQCDTGIHLSVHAYPSFRIGFWKEYQRPNSQSGASASNAFETLANPSLRNVCKTSFLACSSETSACFFILAPISLNLFSFFVSRNETFRCFSSTSPRSPIARRLFYNHPSCE